MKILDTTLRDGGYRWNWKFSDSFKADLYKLKNDFIEMGYFKHFDEKYNNDKVVYLLDFKGKSESDAKLIKNNKFITRIAYTYEDSFDVHRWILENEINPKRVMLQPMRISTVKKAQVLNEIKIANEMGYHTIYLVDSYGALELSKVKALFKVFKDNVNQKVVNIGVHLHNNKFLANEFIKWAVATDDDFIFDVSMNGSGRGGGNMPTHKVYYFEGDKANLYETLEFMIRQSDYFENIVSLIGLLTGIWNVHQKFIDEIIEGVKNGKSISSFESKFTEGK